MKCNCYDYSYSTVAINCLCSCSEKHVTVHKCRGDLITDYRCQQTRNSSIALKVRPVRTTLDIPSLSTAKNRYPKTPSSSHPSFPVAFRCSPCTVEYTICNLRIIHKVRLWLPCRWQYRGSSAFICIHVCTSTRVWYNLESKSKQDQEFRGVLSGPSQLFPWKTSLHATTLKMCQGCS